MANKKACHIFLPHSCIAPVAATMRSAAFVAHRIAKHTPLRRLAPEWHSWDSGARFPMGLALGGTLAIYLLMGIWFGR